jgi:hypothetical protein
LRFEKRGFNVSFDDEIMLTGYADADWAGGPNRKSSSGGMILCDGCSLHSWSKGQSVVAKSSAESEFYSICLCTDEALGWQSLLESIGLRARVLVMTRPPWLSVSG